jgi:outer membrane protein OmpA-like peptidoglycan-associated protein
MSEYNAVIFVSSATPNNSFGPRDPVDGIWGVRLYPFRKLYIDAGYRYMLNLSNAEDRNGFVIKVGTGVSPYKPPPPLNYSPVAACSLDKPSVFAGSNDAVVITTTATDPDGDPLTYSWTATGGSVDGTGAQVRWLSAGVVPGNYTVTVTVSDGRGGTTTCSVNPMVAVRPNRPPTVTLSSDRGTVFIGEKVLFTAVGADPDNDPLTYTWRTTCGQLSGTGTTNTLDTTGVAPGVCTVTVRVDDGRGGAADASKGVNVQAPPPPPQASKLNTCDFKPASSPRVDNVCKRILDDVGLRLQNEPKGTVVIIGYSEPKPAARAAKLATDRGENAKKYLTDKGVDASRITTRTGAGQAGATDNSRIDIEWVPEGATF